MKEFIEVPASKHSLATRKAIYGVGINDAKYLTQTKNGVMRLVCPYYKVWMNMLTRCYDPSTHITHPNYKDCSIVTDWLIFSNFKRWMLLQDWEAKELDKDILVLGNKVYSPETCIFVPQEVNKLLNKKEATNRNFKQGVCWYKPYNKFLAQGSVAGIRKHLGYFNTEEEASKAYQAFKRQHILAIASKQDNIRLKNALIVHANCYC